MKAISAVILTGGLRLGEVAAAGIIIGVVLLVLGITGWIGRPALTDCGIARARPLADRCRCRCRSQTIPIGLPVDPARSDVSFIPHPSQRCERAENLGRKLQ